VNNDHKNPDG